MPVECDRSLADGLVRCHHTDHADACPLLFCSRKCREWAWEHYHKVRNHRVLGMFYANQRGGPRFVDFLFVLKALSMMQLPESNQYALSYITAFLQNPHLLGQAIHYKIAGTGIDQIKIASGYVSPSKKESFEDIVDKLFALRLLYAFGDGGSSYLYGPSCCINHSCEGNVSVGGLTGRDDSEGKKINVRPYGTIRALRPLKKGEQLFCRDSMTPRSTRKANIKAQYGFDCQCRLCNDGIPRCDYEGCQAENFHLKRCAKCQSAVYCGRSCQAKDWKHHKKYCGLKAAGHCN